MAEILLVEDNENDAGLIKRALELAGVSNVVRHVASGAAGFDCLQRAEEAVMESPAVLLVDLKLPDFSGFDILTWLQGRKRFSNMLSVVLSNVDDLASIKKAYSLGAHSYLTKPATQHDFEELINAYPDNWCTPRAFST